jgi:hypothetical protein
MRLEGILFNNNVEWIALSMAIRMLSRNEPELGLMGKLDYLLVLKQYTSPHTVDQTTQQKDLRIDELLNNYWLS